VTAYEEVVEMLRGHGYGPSRSADRWGAEIWARKGCPSVRVPSECSSAAAERVRMQVERDLAAAELKRKPKSFRIRATAAQKALALEKRLREVEARIELSNRELGGMRRYLSADEARAIQLRIEADEREQRNLRALMTEMPSNNAHSGRPGAQHRS
jgi:hypothetical protein